MLNHKRVTFPQNSPAAICSKMSDQHGEMCKYTNQIYIYIYIFISESRHQPLILFVIATLCSKKLQILHRFVDFPGNSTEIVIDSTNSEEIFLPSGDLLRPRSQFAPVP